MMDYITFPGIILHEISHYITCKLLGVKVDEVKLLSFKGDSLGYVKHQLPKSYTKRFLIIFSPFIINNTITIYLIYLITLGNQNIFINFILIYLSFSLSSHSISSRADISMIFPKYKFDYINPLFLLSLPITIIIYLVIKYKNRYFNYIFAILLIILVYSLIQIEWLNHM